MDSWITARLERTGYVDMALRRHVASPAHGTRSPMRHAALVAGVGALLLMPGRTTAQLRRHDVRVWSVATLTLAGAAVGDPWLREELARPGAPIVRTTARTVEPLGRARTALLGLATSFVLAESLDDADRAHATARVAGGYLVADAVTAVLKPAVGRARPRVGAGPHAFRAFAGTEARHSFPSGHATHAFALAAAVAEETHDRPWIGAASFGVAALVGWSRLHDDAHWASDVVAGAMVGTAAGLTTDRWLRRRRGGHDGRSPQGGTARLRLAVVPVASLRGVRCVLWGWVGGR